MTTWNHSVEFLAIGSGAAGMTGALLAHDLGARTLVIEKSDCFGGSTALSGGTIWVPANHLMIEKEISDSIEEGLTYLKTIIPDSSSPDLLSTYLATAPEMVRYLAEHSRVRFECLPHYPDYYPEAPGGKSGGRTIEPEPFNALELGPELERQRKFPRRVRILGFMAITANEVRPMLDGGLPAMALMLRLAAGYWFNIRARIRTRENTRFTLGPGLAARLRRSLMDRDIPLWLNTAVRELITENGRVVGIVAEREGQTLHIQATKGVLLATGGFEKNGKLRQKYQQHPIDADWTVGSADNTGDVIPLGTRIGADLELMEEAWWSPVVIPPGEERPRVLIMEKGLPGTIIVNQRGERFMNEAAPYNDIGHNMYAANSPDAPSIPAYFIFDRAYRRKHPIGSLYPTFVQPDWALSKEIKENFLTIAPTIPELAARLGIDAERLQATIRKFNAFARNGKDADHGRGESLQDRYYSDPKATPNPCLGPLERGPFYAVKVYPGDLGTKGGFRTDTRARVLTEQGDPIPGLYSAGNCSASIMGKSYPGAGATIGPAMAFGYIAARQAVRGDDQVTG